MNSNLHSVLMNKYKVLYEQWFCNHYCKDKTQKSQQEETKKNQCYFIIKPLSYQNESHDDCQDTQRITRASALPKKTPDQNTSQSLQNTLDW